MNPKDRDILINKEVRESIRNITFRDIISALNLMSAAEKAQFVKVIKNTDNRLLQSKLEMIFTPAATSKIDGFITANSFPEAYVSRLITGR